MHTTTPCYLYIVTGAVIVQVLLAEWTWNHLQGSGKSLTHFVPCVFEGLSHAVASLPENTVFCISLKCSSSKLFTGGIVLYADGDFSYSQTSQQYRWTRLLWHDYHKQGKQGLEGN